MAAYIMNLNNFESLEYSFKNGVYSTKVSLPKSYSNSKNKSYVAYWGTPQEGTLADYSTMKEGDNIYFFIDRKIYGIGILKNIVDDCKFNNFPNATAPLLVDYETIQPHLLIDFGYNSLHYRWLCTFTPSPFFFKTGVDMDDVLASNPFKFKMLRAFWKLSFIKIDDEENKALRDILLKSNLEALLNPSLDNCFEFSQATHYTIENKLLCGDYKFDLKDALKSCSKKGALEHEMAIEAGTLHQLSSNINNALETFGAWDYLSHQVIASPFKPIDYMDKMDIFGYKYIPSYPGTIYKYLVIELKRGPAKPVDVEQVLKYVDWINQEYAFGDYSMIEAFLVASKIDDSVIHARDTYAVRNYMIGRRPPQSNTWTNITLVQYTFDDSTGEISYTII